MTTKAINETVQAQALNVLGQEITGFKYLVVSKDPTGRPVISLHRTATSARRDVTARIRAGETNVIPARILPYETGVTFVRRGGK